jgi:hypothetical protein
MLIFDENRESRIVKHVPLLRMQSFRRSKQGPILLGAFLLGASLPAYSAASSDIRVTTETFSYPGVSIVGPTDPSFEGEVRKLFGERASIAEKLAPFLLILKNESPRTIVAYTATWRIKSADGNEMPLAARYMYPMAISGPVVKGDLPRDREVRMGEERLVSAQFEVGLHINASDAEKAFSTISENQSEQFRNLIDVRVSLDAIVFDDGEIVGPDRSQLGDDFTKYVDAYQSLYREIVSSLNAGLPAEQVFKVILDRKERDSAASMQAGQSSNAFDLVAKQDVLGWRHEHGDSDLRNHFLRCTRTPPFALKRAILYKGAAQ